jgi:NAD(P)-dependent dehydrogenase (short-subunit alcohol dehydrogenase family)
MECWSNRKEIVMTGHRLQNKVGIITGAGAGIGRAEALLFAAEGAKIIVADWDKESGFATVKLIKEKGGEAALFQGNINKTEEVKKLIDFCVEKYGKLNILVNNAGINLAGKGDSTVTETSEEIFDQVLGVDLRGSFLCCKYALQQMLKNGGGTIVNTASTAAIRGRVVSAYGIAKSGVLALTRTIAVSYAEGNIRCNTLSPGSTYTELLKTTYQTQEALDARIAKIPMRRFGTPEEIAMAALFLASEESSFMTGTNIIVDGGELSGYK